MANICVDFSRITGKIKPVHSVGQPPFVGLDFSMFSYLKEAHIPYSRLHDVGGPFGGNLYVDIPNLFRDFNADPSDPESYDFTFTDKLITALVENGVEPYFRLGVTIENNVAVKAYRVYPPTDFHKWARICEGVIRHYTEGWANGFRYNIRYWEIWNEPDNFEDSQMNQNQMWVGKKEQFYELYHIAATYLKERFPHLKIGGYGSCGFYALEGDAIAQALSTPRVQYFIDFFDGFLNYIKPRNTPLDFFSWHSYSGVRETRIYAQYARKRLDEAGFTETETSCNEWNYEAQLRGTSLHTAHNTAMLIAFQQSPLDNAEFYDARCGISIYGGLFHPMTRQPYPLYYGFKAFGELYALGNEVYTETEDADIYVSAAINGENGGILIANIGKDQALKLDIPGGETMQCYIIDEKNCCTPCDLPAEIVENTVLYITVQKTAKN